MDKNFSVGLEEGINNLCTRGAFLTVSNEDKVNTMTISWGSVGFMWRKPMFMALVRESRYSNEFLKNGDTYTVSIPYSDEMKKALSICGTKSGRECDKEKEADIKFINSKEVSTPIIEGCDKYYECKVVFSQVIDLDSMDEEIVNKFYADGDKHILYFAEIIQSY